jgi:hypothetical protein
MRSLSSYLGSQTRPLFMAHACLFLNHYCRGRNSEEHLFSLSPTVGGISVGPGLVAYPRGVYVCVCVCTLEGVQGSLICLSPNIRISDEPSLSDRSSTNITH